ncbi:3,4-dihydroxy-2-butanone-4-phosphate synthase [Microbacterium sp. X-17]|uniref:3,4-dihydroxy-2-butanone-4-phosphate synthase n=1 Tax=Microbacterium sp. X-17 TaxID=3144404 RepID=UPI0031F571A5
MTYSPILELVESIRNGGFAILADDQSRENEGDVILAAEFASREALAFMITRGRGLVCLAMTAERAKELHLEQMARTNTDPLGTAFTASIDAVREHGVTTGISASDRAITARLAVDGVADDFSRPGHLFPVVSRPGGVLQRPGHTEAAVDLARLAGLHPMALIVEIIGDDGDMLRGE